MAVIRLRPLLQSLPSSLFLEILWWGKLQHSTSYFVCKHLNYHYGSYGIWPLLRDRMEIDLSLMIVYYITRSNIVPSFRQHDINIHVVVNIMTITTTTSTTTSIFTSYNYSNIFLNNRDILHSHLNDITIQFHSIITIALLHRPIQPCMAWYLLHGISQKSSVTRCKNINGSASSSNRKPSQISTVEYLQF